MELFIETLNATFSKFGVYIIPIISIYFILFLLRILIGFTTGATGITLEYIKEILKEIFNIIKKLWKGFRLWLEK